MVNVRTFPYLIVGGTGKRIMGKRHENIGTFNPRLAYAWAGKARFPDDRRALRQAPLDPFRTGRFIESPLITVPYVGMSEITQRVFYLRQSPL